MPWRWPPKGRTSSSADAPGAMMDLTYPLGTEDDLRDTAKRVEELGRRCLPIALDVRDSAAVGAAVEQTVKDMGSLDIVVANAGIVSTGPVGRRSATRFGSSWSTPT